jgi:hypothetical protein
MLAAIHSTIAITQYSTDWSVAALSQSAIMPGMLPMPMTSSTAPITNSIVLHPRRVSLRKIGI